MSWQTQSGEFGVLPPPLRGRVGEGGKLNGNLREASPTPNPSPQGGGVRSVLAAKGGGR
jgi:hypothetical protein